MSTTVGLAAVANAIVILVWLIADHGFPFFIYSLGGTIAVATIVYVASYVPERKLITAHFLLSVNVNLLLVLTWIFAFTPFPWFIFVLIPCMAMFSLHHLVEQYRSPDWTGTLAELLFKIHLYSAYIPLNVMLFITCLTTDPDLPWFLYPLMVTSVPVSLHYLFIYHKESPHKWFLVHLALFGQVNVFFFMVWYLAGHDFPWFTIIMAITGVLLGIHYGLHFHRNSSPRLQQIEKVGLDTLSQMKEPVHGVVNSAVSTFNNIQFNGIGTPKTSDAQV